MNTKITGGLLALDAGFRQQVHALRDKLLGRFQSRIRSIDVSVDQEEGTGYKSCSVCVDLENGNRVLGRYRDREVLQAAVMAFRQVALQVPKAWRRHNSGGRGRIRPPILNPS